MSEQLRPTDLDRGLTALATIVFNEAVLRLQEDNSFTDTERLEMAMTLAIYAYLKKTGITKEMLTQLTLEQAKP